MTITKVIFLYVLSILLLSCTISHESGGNKKRETGTEYSLVGDKVFLVIDHSTTEAELDQITSAFKKQRNIDVSFSESTFRSNGKIKSIHIKVNCNDGHSGSASTKAWTTRLNNFGFYRDYTKGANTTFSIGLITNPELY